MYRDLIILEKGTQIGMLYKEFYTNKNKEKRIRYRGYIFLGIINNEAVGLEILVYKEENNDLLWDKQDLYRIKRKKKSTNRWINIGYMVKKEKKKITNNTTYHYFYGKLFLAGVEVKITVFPCYNNTFTPVIEQKKNDKMPDYKIELASVIKCGLIELD